MRTPTGLLLPLAALLLATPALANDSTATLSAGGLRFKQTTAIVMAEENLVIRSKPEGRDDSVFEIVIDYVFRNETAQDISETIAFPMPVEPAECERNDGEYADFDRHSFRVAVDGRAVASRPQYIARIGERDVSAALQKLGLSAALLDAGYAKLPAAMQEKLVKAGLASAEYECTKWSTQWVYVWQQQFPAGRDLRVHHRYEPAAGGAVNSNYLQPEARRPGKPDPAPEWKEGWQQDVKRYCMGTEEQKRFRHTPTYRNVAYILKTGANWAGPIRQFRLRIETARPEEKISLCWQGIRKVSPTAYEAVKTDFTPHQDLDILFYTPD